MNQEAWQVNCVQPALPCTLLLSNLLLSFSLVAMTTVIMSRSKYEPQMFQVYDDTLLVSSVVMNQENGTDQWICSIHLMLPQF